MVFHFSKIGNWIPTAATALLFMLTLAAPGTVMAENDPAPAAVANVSGSCPPLASKYVTASDSIQTTSLAYVNVSGTKINFVQGGNKAGCLIVSFTAHATSTANHGMLVRVLVDGTSQCLPEGYAFDVAAAQGYKALGMNFACPKTPPGAHSIKVQYANSDGGTTAFIAGRTTIVHFVP